MGLKSAVAKLKRKIKRKRAWLLAGLIPVALTALLVYALTDEDGKQGGGASHRSEPVSIELDERMESEVVLHKLFICGDEYESLGYYSETELEAMRGEHPDWKLEGIDENKVVYSLAVEDLSPDCRNNAYFGLDHTNSLTLYQGKPEQGKIVRTYFQVNLEHLESSLPQEAIAELKQGIKVTDFAEYNSVLSTFSDYALDEAEQVVKPAP